MLLASLGALGVLLTWGISGRLVIKCTVTNASHEPIRDVIVNMVGSSKDKVIAVLDSGQSSTFELRPTNETAVELSFEADSRSVYGLCVCGYLEKGYSGSIDIQITDDRVEAQTSIRLHPLSTVIRSKFTHELSPAAKQ